MQHVAKIKSPLGGKAVDAELLVRSKPTAGTKKGAGKAEISYIPIEKGLKTVERRFEGLRPLGNLIDEKL